VAQKQNSSRLNREKGEKRGKGAKKQTAKGGQVKKQTLKALQIKECSDFLKIYLPTGRKKGATFCPANWRGNQFLLPPCGNGLKNKAAPALRGEKGGAKN
jgi:hypothetical protein